MPSAILVLNVQTASRLRPNVWWFASKTSALSSAMALSSVFHRSRLFVVNNGLQLGYVINWLANQWSASAITLRLCANWPANQWSASAITLRLCATGLASVFDRERLRLKWSELLLPEWPQATLGMTWAWRPVTDQCCFAGLTSGVWVPLTCYHSGKRPGHNKSSHGTIHLLTHFVFFFSFLDWKCVH